MLGDTVNSLAVQSTHFAPRHLLSHMRAKCLLGANSNSPEGIVL